VRISAGNVPAELKACYGQLAEHTTLVPVRFLRANDAARIERAERQPIFKPMRLTDYTDYSLRVLLFLAVNKDALSTIQDISDAYGISKNHLMKVVQQLGELGWIETVRGRNGGLRLNERSLNLSVGDVVRATESDFALVGCFERDGAKQRPCVIEPHCRLKHVFESAQRAFLAELDRHTIDELIKSGAPLARLLGLGVGEAPVSIVPMAARVPIGPQE
jgi:Rrf2 family nitric oxide-sensitive transcriptional repressor